MKQFLSFSALAGVFALAAQPEVAISQADESFSLEEIIVTARKRAESLQDVPLAVSVVTAAQLERDQIYNLVDMARTTPALEVNPTNGGESNGGGRIRGIGTGVFNRSVSPSVAFVLDQIPQGNLSFPALYDMQQGTLFGQGSSAGVVNITTKAPTLGGFSGNIGLDYAPDDSAGSESLQQILRGAINVPLGETAALRIAGQSRKLGGLQTNVVTGNENEETLDSVRARLLWEASDKLTVDLKAEINEKDISGRDFASTRPEQRPQGTPVSADALALLVDCGMTFQESYADEYCANVDDKLTDDSTDFSAVVTYDFDDISLTSVTAFRTLDQLNYGTNLSRASIGPAARRENIAEESEQFSQEIRLAYGGENLDLTAGIFYSKYDFENSPIEDLPLGDTVNRSGFSVCTADGTFCPRPPSFVYEETENTTTALFADATYRLSDTLAVFGGLRYTDYENESGSGEGNETEITVFDTTSETDVSGRIGLNFQPNDNQTFYGSVATGYKPSAIVVSAATDTVPLEEENSLAFEAGGKFDMGAWNLEANVFHTKLDNYQTQSTIFVGGAAVRSVLNTDIESSGIEITAFGRLSENLTFNAGYLYNDASYADDDFAGDDGLPLGGEQVALSPKHKINLSGEYSRSVGSSLEGFISTSVTYKSEVLLTQRDPSVYTQDASTNIGGSIGIRSRDDIWSASVFVRNLTKERESILYLPNSLRGQPSGSIRTWPYPGVTSRMVGLSLTANF